MRTWIRIIMLAAGVAAATAPAYAKISANLAKTCRAMMVKEYPTQMFGPNGSAALQRDYFKQCIGRQSKMDDQRQTTTTGQVVR